MGRVEHPTRAGRSACEAGLQRIPVDQALKLSAYGIPLDWVYHERMTDLHPHIRAKILELRSES
jgi:hypothetical protein